MEKGNAPLSIGSNVYRAYDRTAKRMEIRQVPDVQLSLHTNHIVRFAFARSYPWFLSVPLWIQISSGFKDIGKQDADSDKFTIFFLIDAQVQDFVIVTFYGDIIGRLSYHVAYVFV